MHIETHEKISILMDHGHKVIADWEDLGKVTIEASVIGSFEHPQLQKDLEMEDVTAMDRDELMKWLGH